MKEILSEVCIALVVVIPFCVMALVMLKARNE
jgi:hypothetical protein